MAIFRRLNEQTVCLNVNSQFIDDNNLSPFFSHETNISPCKASKNTAK